MSYWRTCPAEEHTWRCAGYSYQLAVICSPSKCCSGDLLFSVWGENCFHSWHSDLNVHLCCCDWQSSAWTQTLALCRPAGTSAARQAWVVLGGHEGERGCRWRGEQSFLLGLLVALPERWEACALYVEVTTELQVSACRCGSCGSDWSGHSALRDSFCLSTDTHLRAAASDLLPLPQRSWQRLVLPWQLDAALLPLHMAKSLKCQSLRGTVVRTGSTHWAWKCPGPFGHEQLSADGTGGPKTVAQPFFVIDATELLCRSHVADFWINSETLNKVVLLTGPFIPVPCGGSAWLPSTFLVSCFCN